MNIELQAAFRLLRSEFRRPNPATAAFFRSRRFPVPAFSRSRSHPFSTTPPTPNLDLELDISLPDPVIFTGPAPQARNLPVSCPGCGALTQADVDGEAGYYTISRKGVREYIAGHQSSASPQIPEATSTHHQPTNSSQNEAPESFTEIPYCDRCHGLLHHHEGISIDHPTIASINKIISESPHRRNHIYHVLDAADFPMSLIPNLQERIRLAYVRSKNRRAKQHNYVKGGETEMSFIITRSDLLAPQKSQVDALKPKLENILREAMGKFGENARLHVYLVSSHRGWWTTEVKEEIWDRGGGQWLVGKVNVGKSGLLQNILPKGRIGKPDPTQQDISEPTLKEEIVDDWVKDGPLSLIDQLSNKFSLLPPSQPLVQYPTMPLVSDLPGTTAAPIRLQFGKRKGEIIDLPGIERNSLATYVQEEHRKSLLMKTRIVPQKVVIKPGQSLMLGGLLHITPTNPDQIIEAHVFAPLEAHVTRTDKVHTYYSTSSTASPDDQLARFPNIAKPAAHALVTRASTYKLSTNVTKNYAGPLTRRDAVGLKADVLPFVIYATDILIEGCGWVELVASVRKPRGPAAGEVERFMEFAGIQGSLLGLPEPPQVEVWSPEGKGVGQRECIEAWRLGKPLKKKRPGRSFKQR